MDGMGLCGQLGTVGAWGTASELRACGGARSGLCPLCHLLLDPKAGILKTPGLMPCGSGRKPRQRLEWLGALPSCYATWRWGMRSGYEPERTGIMSHGWASGWVSEKQRTLELLVPLTLPIPRSRQKARWMVAGYHTPKPGSPTPCPNRAHLHVSLGVCPSPHPINTHASPDPTAEVGGSRCGGHS